MSVCEHRHFISNFGDVREWLRHGERLSAAKCAFWTCREAEQMTEPHAIAELADLTDEQFETLKAWSVFTWEELDQLADLLDTY